MKLDDELLHLPVRGPWLRYKVGEEPEEKESPGNEVIAKEQLEESAFPGQLKDCGCFPLCQRFRKFRSEFTVSVSSDRNIRVHLWRWSTYFGRNIATEILTNRFFALIGEFGKRI